jgi:hypothetical protein
MAERLQESLEQHLSYQPYRDGNASGSENDFHGMESFLGYSGTVDETATGPFTSRTANAADRFAYVNDNYAGLSCQLGYYGGDRIGTSSATWPNTPVDPDADFWSPVVINYNASTFGGTKWKDNCVFAIREGIHQCKRNDTKEAQIDLVVVDRAMYIQFLNAQTKNERINVSKENGLKALGFSDVTTIDNVEVTSEYAVPAGKGYGLSIGNMELRCLENQLMVAEGPFFAEETQSYRYACSTLGNFKFKSPRSFFMLANVTGSLPTAQT